MLQMIVCGAFLILILSQHGPLEKEWVHHYNGMFKEMK